MRRPLLILSTLVLAAACATAPIDYKEERRVVGTENGVRVDGLIRGDEVTTQNNIPFSWDVTNERSLPIAVADIVPSSTYDPEERVITVTLGEKKTFSGTIRVQVLPEAPGDARSRVQPRTLRLKLNFLGEVQPFA